MLGSRAGRGRRILSRHVGTVMLRPWGALATVCLALVLASCVPAGPAAWKLVPSPNPTTTENNQLDAVAGVAPGDVWAVGFSTVSTVPQTLTEHWNGAQWKSIPSPNIPGANNLLAGVAGVTPHDAWAVGFSTPGQTLTEHWNGATWAIVPSPNVGPATAFNSLSGVAAVASNNVWAVGEFIRITAHTLVEHWNGVSWSVVPSPNVSGATAVNSLLSVKAIAANNIWAVGDYQATPNSLSETLTEHWNGVSWSIVPSPNAQPGIDNNQLVSVTANAPNDVWAVGFAKKPSPNPTPSVTLIEHWNGASWSIVSSPNIHPGVEDNGLLGVAAAAPNDVWTVGYSGTAPQTQPQTLIAHWDGSTWKIVQSPNTHGTLASNVLAGVAALSPNEVWAVGNYADMSTNIQQTLIELYS